MRCRKLEPQWPQHHLESPRADWYPHRGGDPARGGRDPRGKPLTNLNIPAEVLPRPSSPGSKLRDIQVATVPHETREALRAEVTLSRMDREPTWFIPLPVCPL